MFRRYKIFLDIFRNVYYFTIIASNDFLYLLFIYLRVYFIRSSEKLLSFYKEIMDAQYFLVYIILSNYV